MSKRYKAKRRARYYADFARPGYHHDTLKLDEGPDRCWCGVENPYFHPIQGGCGGHGILDCHCGGDLCVCHNHGEVECLGCEDCEQHDDDCDDCEDCHDCRDQGVPEEFEDDLF